jgi:hypothetical protein
LHATPAPTALHTRIPAMRIPLRCTIAQAYQPGPWREQRRAQSANTHNVAAFRTCIFARNGTKCWVQVPLRGALVACRTVVLLARLPRVPASAPTSPPAQNQRVSAF